MKKEITTIYKQDKDILKERVRINTLKYFHPKLFRRYKKFHRRKIESNDEQETEKTNMNKKVLLREILYSYVAKPFYYYNSFFSTISIPFASRLPMPSLS